MSSFAATVEIMVNAPQALAFEHIVPIELPTIFTGFGPLPAVTGTQNQVGAWDVSGQTRTVDLSDGSSANERLNTYQHPQYFSYTVDGFTGVPRFLATSADGERWFNTRSLGQTSIKWRYAFNPRSRMAAPLVWFIANFLWRRYMQKALRLSAVQVEAKVPPNKPLEPMQ